MCLICGWPHYTEYCPNDSGCPIDFDVNPLMQPQSYQSWNGQPERTPEDFRDWVKAAKEERERGIRAALDSLNSQSLKSQGRYTYDVNGNYLGYQTADGEMDYTILDPGGEMCIGISQSILLLIIIILMNQIYPCLVRMMSCRFHILSPCMKKMRITRMNRRR